MTFGEKLKKIRTDNKLTQDELAKNIFVTRTAISKWESGRGYPSIDSLKTIAGFFGITIDELLSGEEVITIAEEDAIKKEKHFRDLVFGLLDCSAVMLAFLPFFKQTAEGALQSVSLMSLTEIAPYLKTAYFVVVIGIIFLGILTISFRNCRKVFWERNKSKASLMLNVLGALLFIISSQPYAATFLFVFAIIKVLILIKW